MMLDYLVILLACVIEYFVSLKSSMNLQNVLERLYSLSKAFMNFWLKLRTSRGHMKLNRLPLELMLSVMYHCDLKDLISLESSVAIPCNRELHLFVLKTLKALSTKFWRRQSITSYSVLSFIIHKELITLSHPQIGGSVEQCGDDRKTLQSKLRNVLNIDLTSKPHGRTKGESSQSKESNLHYAVRKNLPHIVKYLILCVGYDVNEVDLRGRCPLSMCALNIDQSSAVVQMARLLIKECGADLNYTNTHLCCWTPLHYCAMRDSVGIAELLVSARSAGEAEVAIAIEQKDTRGRSPLSYACEYGSTGITRILTDCLIRKSRPSDFGADACVDTDIVTTMTMTEIACTSYTASNSPLPIKAGDFDCLSRADNSSADGTRAEQALLVDSSIQDAAAMCNTITKASYDSKYYSAVELKRKKECELMYYQELQSPLRAHPSPPKPVIRDLEKDETGYTPLHFAASNGNYDVMLLLLSRLSHDKEASFCTTANLLRESSPLVVDFQDLRGRTALHLACMHGFTNIAALLASKTNDIDVQDARGKTPLHFACAGGHINIATLLTVDYNANTAAIMCQ